MGAPKSWYATKKNGQPGKYTKAAADAKWEAIRSRPKSGSRRVMGRVQIRRQIRTAKKELDRALKTRNLRVIKAIISTQFGRSGLVANTHFSRGPRMPVGLGSGMLAALRGGNNNNNNNNSYVEPMNVSSVGGFAEPTYSKKSATKASRTIGLTSTGRKARNNNNNSTNYNNLGSLLL